MAKIQTVVFLKELLTQGALNPLDYFFTSKDDKEIPYSDTARQVENEIFRIQDVPDYFEFECLNFPKRSFYKKTRTFQGHLIDCKGFDDYSDYLTKRISPKSQSNYRKYRKRLEECLSIRYVVYYGMIDKEEYHNLFKRLRVLIERRFAEKKEANYELPHLQEMEAVVYDLILVKKANLSVIYHNEVAVSIRINMFSEEIGFYIISAYDIDYSKFRLGIIDMLNNIEWCFENGIKKYDLLKGYYNYKQKWITHTYDYFDYLIFDPENVFHRIRVQMILLLATIRFRLLEYSQKTYLFGWFKRFKRWLHGIAYGSSTVKYEWLDENEGYKPKSQIDVFANERYASLKRPVLDFMYNNKIKMENLSVFSIHDQERMFKLNGKEVSSLVRLKSN